MTVETALITAVSAVTSALVFVCGKLWQRSEDCESDRRALRDEIEDVKERAGISQGRLTALESCPQNSCPFKKTANTAALALAASALLLLLTGCIRGTLGVNYTTPQGATIGGTLELDPGYARQKGARSADTRTERVVNLPGAPFPAVVTNGEPQ